MWKTTLKVQNQNMTFNLWCGRSRSLELTSKIHKGQSHYFSQKRQLFTLETNKYLCQSMKDNLKWFIRWKTKPWTIIQLSKTKIRSLPKRLTDQKAILKGYKNMFNGRNLSSSIWEFHNSKGSLIKGKHSWTYQ